MMKAINQDSDKSNQKTSDSFMVEEFFKGQKEIFNPSNMYNQAIGEDNSGRQIKNYDSGDNQEGSTKEDDPNHIQELSSEHYQNSNTERSQQNREHEQNEQQAHLADQQQQLTQDDENNEEDGYQQNVTEGEQGYLEYDIKKLQEREKEEENKKALQTFKQLLQKSNNNIDESVAKEEIIPFQQDISQIDAKQYEQNHVYNLDNDNTEYILRNAEKYLDSPNYYQEDQTYSNEKKQSPYIPEECRGNIVEQFDERQKENQFISQIQAQKQKIQDQQRQDTDENEISFHQQQNNFSNQIQDLQIDNKETIKIIQQDCSPLHKSDSQVTFERCQNIEKIIEEYERSIQNLSQVEEQPAVLRSRSDLKLLPRSSQKLRDSLQLENNKQEISSSTSINQIQKAPSSIATPSKQTSIVSTSSKPPKDTSKRDSIPKLNTQESTDKDVKYQFQIALLESENKDLKQQIHQVQLEKEALQLKIDRLESKNESLTKTLTQFKEKLSLVASIDSEISANLEILSVENQELISQNEQNQQNIKNLTNQNNALHIENKNLLESIKNMKTQIQYFQEKIDQKFDEMNSNQAAKNDGMKEEIEQKIKLVKQCLDDYIHQNSELNLISKEVLKAYAPQKLQTKIDIKIKQIEKNSQSSQNYIDQALENLMSQIKELCQIQTSN